jgi:NAD(P)-dependent dehydrogenase (short-subunit alcohol dehydrogenase family)
MDLHLENKTALVTGASRGIGLAIVKTLVEEGVRVVAASRTITAELKETGAFAVSVDLTTPGGPDRLVAEATAAVGGLDLLVNNVGGGDTGESQTEGLTGLADELWAEIFELNFFATMRTTRAALPSLIERRGAVVSVSSIGARMPQSGPIAYTTAKAALTAFGKALAKEMGPHGVRVNTVSPGLTRTALWESPDGYGAAVAKSMGITLPELLAQLPSAMNMTTGRFIEPAEVATMVAYLCSPLAGSITGTDHLVDGGAVKTA